MLQPQAALGMGDVGDKLKSALGRILLWPGQWRLLLLCC